MQLPPHEDGQDERLGELGCEYYTELAAQYVEDLPEADRAEVEVQSDRNVVWFRYLPEDDDDSAGREPIEMSISVYPDSPAVTVGTDTRVPYHSFQENAAWVLRTCADFGVGIDLEVEQKTGETWLFIFLRVFWAGFNLEVLAAALDDLSQCRRALEARLPLARPSEE